MRTILTTIALAVALAVPAQAQDLRSPDARGASPSAEHRFGAIHHGTRIAGRAGWIGLEPEPASQAAASDTTGSDVAAAVAAGAISGFALAALGGAMVLQRRRRLA